MNRAGWKIFYALVMLLFVLSATVFAADTMLKPYLLGYRGPGTIKDRIAEVKTAMEKEGFQIVGEYEPYTGAHVLVVTSDALKSNAAKSPFGAYGAMQRISLTETGKELQIASTNPLYMAQIYQMKGDLADVAAKLQAALGKAEEFGSKKGLKASSLRDYHYMVFMPYFTDQVKLASYGSYDEAIKAVEAGLAKGTGGTDKVYRVDIPGKQESVFGVGIKEGEGADKAVMKVVDLAELKQTPHLPYELVVSEGNVYMLHGKFRIAQSFPDLSMGTFMKISGAPGAIENTLKQVAGGK